MNATVSTASPGTRALSARLGGKANAIWMREMRQNARLPRTPWILFALTLLIALLMCAIAGLAGVEKTSPAELGAGLFQGYFSIAFFVVSVAGPTIAANSIASEREGRTWEAIQLTGLHALDVARGKFMAAYTTIALYIVVLAPVGALPFLFGGVAPVEVILAFVFLFIIAGLAVAFGLAISSFMSSQRGAIVATLLLTITIAPTLYLSLGVWVAFLLNRQWNALPAGAPVWLPLAFTRAPLGLAYFVELIAAPLVVVCVPAWLLYEVTVSNLTGETDNRATGLKRWFTVSTPLVGAVCGAATLLAPDESSAFAVALTAISMLCVYLLFCALLFAFDTPGASRRVEIQWGRAGAGSIRRFFGPGIAKTSVLVVGVGLAALAEACAIAVTAIANTLPPAPLGSPATLLQPPVLAVLVFCLYAAAFFTFTAALIGWLRVRGSSNWNARVIGCALLLLIAAGPWIVAAIVGMTGGPGGAGDQWFVIGTPSPFFAFVIAHRIFDAAAPPGHLLPAAIAASTFWALFGVILLGATARRCARIVAEARAAVARTDALLRQEDELARARQSDASP